MSANDTIPLHEQARAIMRKNDRGTYTVPTHGLYPYQWNWDSAFAAWGFATFDVERAWVELETLMASQWPSGMVPHIVFHESDPGYFPGPDVWDTGRTPATTGISQPPIAATAARAVFEADPSRPRMAMLYPKLMAWHRWFMETRLDQGAVCLIHPWEAGRDNAPDWDGAMANVDTTGVGDYTRRDTAHVNPEMRPKKEDYDRYLAILYHGRSTGWDDAQIAASGPFRVADPGMTFILLRACHDLAAIGSTLGEDTSEIKGWIAVLTEGAKSLWNEDIQCYDSRDVRTGLFSDTLSSASFLCWYAGVQDFRMTEHLYRIFDQVDFAVPSYDPEGHKFDGLRYWRGPVWGIMNMLISIGLSEAGLGADAQKLRRDTRALIEQHGFYEYFDPHGGQPAGGSNFTWTAAIWLIWAGEN